MSAVDEPVWIDARRLRVEPRDMRSALGTVYFIQARGTNRVKIGWTSGDVEKRLRQLEIASPFPLEVVAVCEGVTLAGERELHAHFASLRLHGEWFARRGELAEWLREVRP